MERFSALKTARIVFVICAATAIVSHAQTFTTLLNFDDANGANPDVGVVQGMDGNFYGTTERGGTSDNCVNSNGITGCGTVYKITSAGLLTTLYSFDITDGAGAVGLVQASNGILYGVTGAGGTSGNCQSKDGATGCGTVFKITTAGKLTTLHNFSGMDGAIPTGLVQGTDGNFYGITILGGTGNDCPNPGSQFANGCGTVFKMTAAGTLTSLYSFCSQPNCADGSEPTALIEGTDGNFYGSTLLGGGSANCTNGCGTIFKLTPSGTLTTLHSFDFTAGAYPGSSLALASDGNFYGITQGGGANSLPDCASGQLGGEIGCGTMFRITPEGTLTTLYNFCSQANCADGGNPGGPIQGSDENFYGGTSNYGEYGYGTIFKIALNGTSATLTTLHNFDLTDGASVSGGVQATNGSFYGTTGAGGNLSCGDDGCGTVWTMSVGLGPFVETLPTSGKVGKAVKILGNNLTGTTSVSFNGTAATFTVVSASEITTTVPSSATTGTVKVVTPSGTLNSNVVFRVTPQILGFTPPSGPVGTPVTVTGVSLKQTKAVVFGGVKATQFTVNSDTQVTATVPAGAKTGKIGITTEGGTATSATSFTVTTTE